MKQKYVSINNYVLPILIAETQEEQAKGLMNIKPPVPNMAFPYHTPKVNWFWMKNCQAELDIIFCNNGKVISICKGVPYSTGLVGTYSASDLVLEFPYGTVKDLSIKIGEQVEIF